jgi:hypothetical protein
MRYPFEATVAELEANLDSFVDAVFSCLESEFLVMPKGEGFVEYPVFEQGYEALKRVTSGFTILEPGPVLTLVQEQAISLIVLRTMLGFTPSEWAYVARQRTGVDVTQGAVRGIDRKIRLAPLRPLPSKGVTGARIAALVGVACQMLAEGASPVPGDKLHRLDKADTRRGGDGLRSLASIGVPYAMLLYERFLGRPFAGHRDSVSELVGDSLESAIEDVLAGAHISYRKTKRAERVPDFDQAPDFIIPSEFSPKVVIEAKLTEDDGTARDKVTRVQHLAELASAGQRGGAPKFEVVACIAGRGFGERRGDMEKLIIATRGKVFTMQNLGRLVDSTSLEGFKTG